MRKSVFTLILTTFLFFGASYSFAQVEEQKASMSLGDQPALVIDIDNVSDKDLQSFFKDFFRDFGKVKYNRKAKEYYISGAEMKRVSKDDVNVYAKIEELNKASRLYLWIDNGEGFVSRDEYGEQYDAASDILVDLDIHIEKTLIEKELKEAEKSLGKMERSAKQLVKDNEKYKKTIEDARKKIAKMEEAIIDNEKAQDDKSVEIKVHKEAIEEIRERLNNVGKSKKLKM